jgi:hypothetical protein
MLSTPNTGWVPLRERKRERSAKSVLRRDLARVYIIIQINNRFDFTRCELVVFILSHVSRQPRYRSVNWVLIKEVEEFKLGAGAKLDNRLSMEVS